MRTALFVVLPLIGVLSCVASFARADEAPLATSEADAIRAGVAAYSFELSGTKLTPAAIAHRARMLAELTGPFLDVDGVTLWARNALQNDLDTFDTSEFLVSHDPHMNRTVMINKSIKTALPSSDIGEGEAFRRFRDVAERLSLYGIMEKWRYNLTQPEKAHVFGGAARRGEPLQPRLIEYNFIAFRTINEIPFPHNRLSVCIRADGRVSEIEVGGPDVQSVRLGRVERPLRGGAFIAHRIVPEKVQERFQQAYPESKVSQLALMYAATEDLMTQGHLIEPKYVVFAVPRWQTDGQTYSAKKRIYTYRLDDEAAEAIDVTD